MLECDNSLGPVPCPVKGDDPEFDQCGKRLRPPDPISRAEQIANYSELNKAYLDKFLLVLDLPPCLKVSGKPNSKVAQCNERVQEIVKADSILYTLVGVPSTSLKIDPVDLAYSGDTISVSSHNRQTDPLSISYMIDSLYENYWVLWQWMEMMAATKIGFPGKNPAGDIGYLLRDYSTTVTVYSLGEYKKPTAMWRYEGAFPTSVESIKYGYTSEEPITNTFTMSYSFVTMDLI